MVREVVGAIGTLDEAALLRGLRVGDAKAYEHLVRTYTRPMLTVARRLLRNDADAADAVQDAFVSAFRSILQFDGQAKIGSWLYRIAMNSALMKVRTRKRKAEVSIENLLPTFYDDGHRRDPRPAWEAPTDVLIQREETRVMVRTSIDRLPDDYRTVLLLCDIEELDTEGTAKLLETTPGAVKTRLHRARQALRTLLENELLGARPCAA